MRSGAADASLAVPIQRVCVRAGRRARAVLVLLPLLIVAGCDGGSAGAGGAAAEVFDAETTYRRYCISCHASGAAGAPRLGDGAAWAPRVAAGWSTLWEHTVQGVRGMPPRGLCTQCSDDELASVLGWMLTQSGGLPADAPSLDGVSAVGAAAAGEAASGVANPAPGE